MVERIQKAGGELVRRVTRWVGLILFFGGSLSGISSSVFAQTGTVIGRVVDPEKKPLAFYQVVLMTEEGELRGGAYTDDNGEFQISNVIPGQYILEVRGAAGEVIRKQIFVDPDRITDMGAIVFGKAALLEKVVVEASRGTERDQTTKITRFTREEIVRAPTRNARDLVALTGGAIQRAEGGEVNIRAARTSGNQVIIDGGIKLTGASGLLLPKNAIQQMTVITGGIPAKYGDATGGIVHITTRGITSRHLFALEAVTSQFLDPYGYNVFSLAASGPIIRRELEGSGEKVPILGYFLAGEVRFERDPRPVFFAYKVKDSIFQQLVEKPLIRHPERGFIRRVETLTADAFEPVKARPNVPRFSSSFTGKLTYRKLSPAGNEVFRVDLSGYLNYIRSRSYIHRYSLFNWERHGLNKNLSGGVTLNITQQFTRTPSRGEEARPSGPVRGFFYNLLLSYSFSRSRSMDYFHRDRIFDYGYIGKFVQYREPIWVIGFDSATNSLWNNMFVGYRDTLATFEPGGKNPYLENITLQYYEEAPEPPASIWELYNAAAIANGERTLSDFMSYTIWFIPGRQLNGYSRRARNTYRIWFNAGMDLRFQEETEAEEARRFGGLGRGHHSVEFGFEYQQDVVRFWQISPATLWTLMRQYANRHLRDLNTADPILIIDGVPYRWSEYRRLPLDQRPQFDPEHDRIYYEPVYRAEEQTWFDRSVRQKLGLPIDGTDFLQIDTLPPDFFSLDMFIPDELFLDGTNTLIFYYGYDYLGKKLPRRYTFYDFWRAKDENGNFYRPVPAFRPVYMAFYIQDKFRFRDIIFNVGLRVDRYDANQPVLKDKYLIMPARTASEVDPSLNPAGTHPANIGPDYVVYVDDARNPTRIVGYRKGDRWFDAQGNEIDDPGILAAQTATGTIQPYLVNPEITEKDTAFDPSLVFESYKPAWTIMPRLSFSFPISDRANFYAHYDVLTQRPREAVIGTPFYYYFIRDIATDFVLPNPGLRPEKVIDYEVGFKQAVADGLIILSIAGFYREFREMIQATRINYAYPVDYMTFDNLDFGTAKGIIFEMSMRRLRTLYLSGKISYTLQFARGTGSNFTSQLGLIRFGEPNLRTIVPLDYDQRHTLTLYLDYTLPADVPGPAIKMGDKRVHPLRGFGATLYVIAGSGTPYTIRSVAIREAILGGIDRSGIRGGINAARKPWTFRVDLKLRKGFLIQAGGRKQEGEGGRGGQKGRVLRGEVYLNIFNLLNRRNVISVWAHTGSPVDDGYLESPQGKQDVSQQLYPQAYADQYRLFVQYPFNFDMPRRIHLGVLIRF